MQGPGHFGRIATSWTGSPFWGMFLKLLVEYTFQDDGEKSRSLKNSGNGT